MNAATEKAKIETNTILFASLKVALRNILPLLVIFIAAHGPVFLVNAFISRAGLGLDAERITDQESAAGPLSAQAVAVILGLLAMTFTIVCCAKVTESARLGKPVSIFEPLRHGVSRIGKAIVTSIPFFAVYLLWLTIAVIGVVIHICLGILIIIPVLLLTITMYLLIISISIRGQSGWKTYSYVWNLAKDEWQYLIGNYLVMGLIAVIISCPVAVAATQVSQTSSAIISSIGSMAAEFLSVLWTIAMTLCFLDIEDRKSRPSTGLELPYGGLVKEE